MDTVRAVVLGVGVLSLLLTANPVEASLQSEGVILNPAGLPGSPADELAWLEGFVGMDLIYFEKWDAEDNELDPDSPGVGAYAFDPASPDTDIAVTWNLNGTDYDLAYVLVKSGAIPSPPGPPDHLYHLYSVTADQVKDSISPQTVTANGSKEISHISFFGKESTNIIPEASTILVWTTLSGLAIAFPRRRRR